MRSGGLCELETQLGLADLRGAVGWQVELWHVFATRVVAADVGSAHAAGGALGFTHRKYGGYSCRVALVAQACWRLRWPWPVD